MRVLVTGDRNWTAEKPILLALKALPPDSVIIHGAARGADSIADTVAKTLGLSVESHPADWEKYHRSAGPIRNQEMLKSSVVLVFAFHDSLPRSKGTRDMVKRSIKAKVPVTLHSSDGSLSWM